MSIKGAGTGASRSQNARRIPVGIFFALLTSQGALFLRWPRTYTVGAPREGEQARRPSSSRGRGCLRGVNDVRARSTSASIISPAGEISGRRAVARARRSGVRPPDPPRTRSRTPAYSPTVRTPPGPACAPPSHRPVAAFCARSPGLHAPLACREPAHPSHPFVR